MTKLTVLYASLLLFSKAQNLTECVETLPCAQNHAALRCVVVSECICFKKREGEIEDRGKGCRETESSVVGGRDWREREREQGCWG